MAPSIKKINIMTLINSIKMRPALYNKDDPMYHSNKKFKFKLWREVCQEVCRNWDCLAPHDKLEYARDLQKRWKSLRTCFTREISLQKKERIIRQRNEPLKKRKKYEYFNSLLFLLSRDQIEEDNLDESDSDDDPLESTVNVEYATTDALDADSEQEVSADKFKESAISHIKTETQYVEPIGFERPVDDKLLDVLRETKELENDEDKMFALSLVSIFKNLNPKKKIEARIEVLKLLQSITYRKDDSDLRYG